MHDSPATIGSRFDLIFRVVGAGLIVVGIFLVLQPFLSALLVAGVLTIATWPLFLRVRDNVGGRSTAAAAIMLLLMIALIVIPLALLAGAVAEHMPVATGALKKWLAGGFQVPEVLRSVPLIGERLHEYLTTLLADQVQAAALLQRLAEPIGRLSFAVARVLGDGIVQLVLVAFILFFFYRDGDRIAQWTERLANRLSGSMTTEVLQIITGTTRSVVIGIVGTAMAQGLVAFVGFLIAGVPGAFLLGVGTFVLSVIPMGPVLLWGGAAIWLYFQGELGWAIFMALYGTLVISSIDNFLKPILISRGSTLGLGLIFLGVLGGVLAFGFIGVILGPVLLALGLALARAWISTQGPALGEATGATAAAAVAAVAKTAAPPNERAA